MYCLTVLIHVALCIGYGAVSGRCDKAFGAHPSLLTFHPAMLLCFTPLFLLSALWLFFFFLVGFVSSSFLPPRMSTRICVFYKPPVVIKPHNIFIFVGRDGDSTTSGAAFILLSHAWYMQASDASSSTLPLLIIHSICNAGQWIFIFLLIYYAEVCPLCFAYLIIYWTDRNKTGFKADFMGRKKSSDDWPNNWSLSRNSSLTDYMGQQLRVWSWAQILWIPDGTLIYSHLVQLTKVFRRCVVSVLLR